MLNEALLIFASSYPEQKLVKCLSFLDTVQTNEYCSNSVILSLAAHVTFKFPYLNLFSSCQNMPKIVPQKCQINEHMTHHPLQEIWCDRIVQAIEKNHAIRKNEILYVVLDLTNQEMNEVMKQKQKLWEFSMKYEQKWVDKILQKITAYQELPRKNTTIAYLNVSGSQLRNDPFMPIINVRAIIMGQIYNNENWKSYNILKHQIPTLDDFLSFDGVIIPGSTNSVLSKIPSVDQMSQKLFQAFNLNKKLKIFGICYGHQLIAHKNNGYVVKKRRTDKVEKYEFKEKMITQLSQDFEFLRNMMSDKTETLLLQHHEDYVEQVSDDFYILATSETSKAQIVLHKSGRIMSFQSHPEYFYEYNYGYGKRIMKYKYGQESQNSSKTNKHHFMSLHHQSSVRMRKVISEFLNWNAQKFQNKS